MLQSVIMVYMLHSRHDHAWYFHEYQKCNYEQINILVVYLGFEGDILDSLEMGMWNGRNTDRNDETTLYIILGKS